MDSRQLYAEYQALAGRRDPAALQRRSQLVPLIAQARKAERGGVSQQPMQAPAQQQPSRSGTYSMTPDATALQQMDQRYNQAGTMGDTSLMPGGVPRPIAGPPMAPVGAGAPRPIAGTNPMGAPMPQSGTWGQAFPRRR